MDAVERLPFDTVLGASLSASEHVQRYRWASMGCRGLRVLDLCCGVGYGSQILREGAASVTGVDYDQGAIDAARAAGAGSDSDLHFELGDAHRWLDEDLSSRFDAIVCFEGLEHLAEFGKALDALKRHAARGVRLFMSIPNSRTFEEDNEFHVTNLDYEGALAAFGALPGSRIFYQYAAEGALILDDEGSADGTATLQVPDRAEPEYANTFLCVVGVPDKDVAAAAGHMRFTLAPFQMRELRNLAKANDELWDTNRQLGRQLAEIVSQLEKGDTGLSALRSSDTAAGTAINKLVQRAENAERDLAAMGERLGDASAGWGRYNELRNRKLVRLALLASRLVRR